LTLSLGVATNAGPQTDRAANAAKEVHMKIRLMVNDKTVSARVIDSPTARDFIALLPLTVTMNDLFRREKFARLPRPISTGGNHTHTYALGDIAYWPPGPDVAIYYDHDGERIPDPGIIVIGKVSSGLNALNLPGAVKVSIELEK
jgi:hypothetical protein